MNRSGHRKVFRIILTLALLCVSSTLSTAQKANKTFIYTSPTLKLSADATEITPCNYQEDSSVVHLNAEATSANPNILRYNWRTTGGVIEGEGANVSWYLSGLKPGNYKAYVEIESAAGDETCEAFSSTTVVVNKCPALPPVCPTMSIASPDNPVLGQPLTFTSSVSGGRPAISPIYNWSVSNGTIIAGQGSETIKVDLGSSTTELTTTLSLGGFPMDCSITSRVYFPAPIERRKFDDFSEITRNDEKARLDNFAIELQNDPTATAYVVVYPTLNNPPELTNRRLTRIADYLVNSRAIDSKRIVTLTGKSRAQIRVELWICPRGCKAPTP